MNTTPQKRLHPVNVRMSDEMRDELRRIAAEDGRTISNLVVKIINDWLADRAEIKAKR
jgi:predicted DNA-binding protein